MRKKFFGTRILGYNKRQVEQYLVDMRKDYEEELSKKKKRMLELVEENRKMKSQIEEMQAKLTEFADRKHIFQRLWSGQSRKPSYN